MMLFYSYTQRQIYSQRKKATTNFHLPELRQSG